MTDRDQILREISAASHRWREALANDRRIAERVKIRAEWEASGRAYCIEDGPCTAHAAQAESAVQDALRRLGPAPEYRPGPDGQADPAWAHAYAVWDRDYWQTYHGIYLRVTQELREQCLAF